MVGGTKENRVLVHNNPGQAGLRQSRYGAFLEAYGLNSAKVLKSRVPLPQLSRWAPELNAYTCVSLAHPLFQLWRTSAFHNPEVFFLFHVKNKDKWNLTQEASVKRCLVITVYPLYFADLKTKSIRQMAFLRSYFITTATGCQRQNLALTQCSWHHLEGYSL